MSIPPSACGCFAVKENDQRRYASVECLQLGKNGRRFVSCVLALLAIPVWLPAVATCQDTPAQAAEPVATATVVDTQQLADEIEEARVKWGVPGMSVAIVYEDRIILNQGFGVLTEGGAERVDADSLFAIASNSKAFTAAALAILVDEGRLDWDDRVSKYLPWLRLRDPLATSQLTIRDLCCHRAGLGTFSGDLLWWGTNYSSREVLERAAILEPASGFREKYGYSNLMFLAAGQVIETVSGDPWPEFVKERILEPAGMGRTIASVRELVEQGNYATPHKTMLDGSQPLQWMNWDTMAAAGGLISSSTDMAQWLKVQLRQGKLADGETLFSSAQAREMWRSHTPIAVSASSQRRYPSTHFRAYGLGWSLRDYKGVKICGHGGGYDGMYSQVAMVPEKSLGIVVLTNSMTSIGSAVVYQVLDRFLGGKQTDWHADMLASYKQSRVSFQKRISDALKPAATNTKPSHALDAYAGRFQCPMYGSAQVSIKDGQLVLAFEPNKELVGDLEHLHYDTFAIQWRSEFAWFGQGTATFVSNSKGKVTSIELDVPNDDLWFYEIKLQRQ